MQAMKITSTRHTQIRILNSVCRIAHATDNAAMIAAPQGPPAAVPAATFETALPASTPAFAIADVALTAASVPWTAACVAVFFPTSFPAFLMPLPMFFAALEVSLTA